MASTDGVRRGPACPTLARPCRPTVPAVVPALRPSEYTAALIQVLRAEAGRCPRRARARDRLAAAASCWRRWARWARPRSAASTSSRMPSPPGTLLLGELGHGATAELHRGDMWQPVAGRRFDLIVANLPHFPMEPVEVAGRLPTWSAGGADGRCLLDPFLEGLAEHLAAGRPRRHHPQRLRRPRAVARDLATRSGLVDAASRSRRWSTSRRREARPHDRRTFCAPRTGGRSIATAPIPSARCTSSKSPRRSRGLTMRVMRAALSVSPLAGVAFAVLPARGRDARCRAREADRGRARRGRGACRLHGSQCRPAGPHLLREPHPRSACANTIRCSARARATGPQGYDVDVARAIGQAAGRRAGLRPRQCRHPHPAARRGPHRRHHRDHGPQHPARRPGSLHPPALLPVRDDHGRARGRSP